VHEGQLRCTVDSEGLCFITCTTPAEPNARTLSDPDRTDLGGAPTRRPVSTGAPKLQDTNSGRVVAQHRGAYTVITNEGDERRATLAGSLRHAGEHAAVGDRVDLQHDVITRIAPRHGVVRRGDEDAPLAANVDQAWIVTALGRDVNPRRVERYLALAAAARVDPVVIVNKADLDPEPPLGDALGELRAVAPGVPVLPVSAQTGAGTDALEAMLAPDKTAVLLGSSGAGKSTLTNRLLGDERQSTGAVRDDDERGRHTTTRRELIPLPGGGALIDTPGLRAVPVTGDAQASHGAFPEIDELALNCRFSDCSHTTEPGCAVRDAVDPERLASYHALTTEARTTAERKRAGRIGARALRQLYDDRPGGRRG
jgi:ribosome biogenesis GTPase